VVAEDLVGVEAGLGCLHLADRVGGDQAFLLAASRMRSRMERQAITPLWLNRCSNLCCQRSTPCRAVRTLISGGTNLRGHVRCSRRRGGGAGVVVAMRDAVGSIS
jgi:hypothetical protein